MAASEPVLRWSSQLRVAPPSLSSRLRGDKLTLPQSALEQLLAVAPFRQVESHTPRALTPSFDPFNLHTFAAESHMRERSVDRQRHLPHPLIFRVVNPQNGRTIYAGIREFSAAENEVCLSTSLRSALGIHDNQFLPASGGVDSSSASGAEPDSPTRSLGPIVTVHASQLPKGTYVRLRPLAAGYDPEDWKALLERYLRDNFTTLTSGGILTVADGRDEPFQFLVDRVEPPGDGICVIDTDLEVDIVALTEDQARETLKKRLEKTTRSPQTKEDSSVGGPISIGEAVKGQVIPGEYVDYELLEWNRGSIIDVELDAKEGAKSSLFVSPYSSRQRHRPRDNVHVFGNFSTRPSKRIRIHPTSVELEGAEALYISVNGLSFDNEDIPKRPLQYELRAVDATADTEVDKDKLNVHGPGDVQCKNCQQWVPQRTFVLHESFCLRNNVLCKQCDNIFQRNSREWQGHWHCPYDTSYGNDEPSKQRHDTVYHTEYVCSDCPFSAESLPSLAHHRATLCPAKPILCQFCHLVVPQQGESDLDVTDPEVVLSGLTPHELTDGSRTTECYICSKIIRLRDMTTHLRHHDLDRLSRPAPRICMNVNCGRALDGLSGKNSLGLCSICFGPLYVDTYDPEGKALQRRIDRRYMSQLLTGCGKPWCQNKYCKTGRHEQQSSSAAEISKLVRPLVDGIDLTRESNESVPFYFCTDQVGQQRRNLADMLSVQGAVVDGKTYDLAWCIGSVEASAGDAEGAREWLVNMAPAKEESV